MENTTCYQQYIWMSLFVVSEALPFAKRLHPRGCTMNGLIHAIYIVFALLTGILKTCDEITQNAVVDNPQNSARIGSEANTDSVTIQT